MRLVGGDWERSRAYRGFRVCNPFTPRSKVVTFCDDDGSWAMERFDPLLAAFCTWTYERTGG